MDRTHYDLTSSRILVVDDVPENIRVMCHALENEGYEVQVAPDGEKGLELATRSRPDLILLDIMMPKMDGYETCRQLKAQEVTREIPVIFLTALDGLADVVKGFNVGGADYVRKPFRKEEVLARVHTHLERAHLIRAAAQKRQALVELNAELEALVAQRTQELQAQIGKLERRKQSARHLLDIFKQHQTLKVLATSSFFQGLDEATLRDLAPELEPVFLPGGEQLIRQGDPGDALYVILNGRLRVVVEQENGDEVTVGEVGQGECVGEMAVLTQETRSASLYAIRDSSLVKLSKEGFNQFRKQNPHVMDMIIELLVRRIREQNLPNAGRKARQGTSVALVAHSLDVPLTEFAIRLNASLAKLGASLHLNARLLDDYLGGGMAQTLVTDSKNRNIVAWLSEQEISKRFVIYEADLSPSAWTRRCLRQADLVFIVGKAGTDPKPNEIEAEILGADDDQLTARKELVVLHDNGRHRPTETDRWLVVRDVESHHHVRLAEQSDFARLARAISGRTVGLVLSGGAARGYAHIGVIRALEERGIPIDVIGGASIGSVMAALYALGFDFETMVEVCHREMHKGKAYNAYTFPMVALLNDRKFNAMLQSMFGDVRIEDLWLPYFCVSSNLTRAEERIYRSGPLWKGVRASTSIPGGLPPVFEGGEVYVDGGVLNNLPTDVMRRLCEGYVIASDVSGGIDMETQAPDYEYVSGWRLLFKRLNPFFKSESLPSLIGVTMRSAELGSVQNTIFQRQEVDFFLRPPVTHFGAFATESIAEIAEAGYAYAAKQIEGWDLDL